MLPTVDTTNPKSIHGNTKYPATAMPVEVRIEVSLAMSEGEAKYGKANYLATNVCCMEYLNAARRHLDAWEAGQDEDPDLPGISHLSKAMSSLTVLRMAQIHGTMLDDRPARRVDFSNLLTRYNQIAVWIRNKHADKKPHHYLLSEINPDNVKDK